MTIAHIINPVKVPESSDLFVAQPVTFETMRRAREFARGKVEVSLLSAQYPEDHEIIPEYFTKTADLRRSVLDLGTFKKQRKLPLIVDILAKALEGAPGADYIIYTNSDIALMPHFYLFVAEQIENGLDAFIINRRTISKGHNINTLALAYTEYGEDHPGFDCFVIKRELLPKFQLNKVAIGVSKIGITLLINMYNLAKNFRIFEHEHLTFHIGEDKVWQNPDLHDYFLHNSAEAKAVYDQLIANDPDLLNRELIKKHHELLKNVFKEEQKQPEENKKNKASSKIFKKFW